MLFKIADYIVSHFGMIFDIVFIAIPWFIGVFILLCLSWYIFMHWLWGEILNQKRITGEDYHLKLGCVNIDEWINSYHHIVSNRRKDGTTSFYVDSINVNRIFTEIDMLSDYLFQECKDFKRGEKI